MSESRGNLLSVLDPSNPSVNKQVMLDWLRINHPQTPIPSKANKAEVAQIVREKQPHLFGTSNPEVMTATSSIPDVYPNLEHLRVSTPIAPKSFESSQKLAKRSASQDLEVPYPHKRIGNMIVIPPKHVKVEMHAEEPGQTHGGSNGVIKKKKPARRPKGSKPKTQHVQPGVSHWAHALPPTKPSAPLSSISAVSDEDEKHELEALKKFAYTPLNDQNGPKKCIPSPCTSKTKLPISSVNIQTSKGSSMPEASIPTQQNNKKPQVDHIHDDVDLIEFSDTEVFEVGNLVIGRDIPTIQMQERRSPSNRKTGVDVFQEEQQREHRVKTLEERLASLESSLEVIERKSSARLFQEMQEQPANNASTEPQSSLLDQAKQDIRILLDRVDQLETETIDLQHDLEMAHIKIQAHHRVFRRILGPDSGINLEEQYDSDPEFNESDINPGSCDNDSTISE